MKKYVIVGLIIIVGGALLIYPMLQTDDPIVEYPAPAEFKFVENLATVGDEVVPVSISVSEKLSKLELYYNDSLFTTWTNLNKDVSFDLKAGVFGVGARTISLLATLTDGSEYTDTRIVRVLSDIVPERMTVNILKEYPHNSQSFTQGLEFCDGRLYEGTGDPGDRGATLIAEVNLNTGEHLKSMGLNVGFFGEGITIHNNTLYQLTYKNGKCYSYDLSTLQHKQEFNYQGEGWGLCNDGKQLIMSNGTERITFRDPGTFTTTRTIEVYNNKGPIINLNELEYIDGKIYANIWTTNLLVVIDPISGKVLQEIDATTLMNVGRGNGEVLNGIARDDKTGKVYMTGKYWPKLFEVEFSKADALP